MVVENLFYSVKNINVETEKVFIVSNIHKKDLGTWAESIMVIEPEVSVLRRLAVNKRTSEHLCNEGSIVSLDHNQNDQQVETI